MRIEEVDDQKERCPRVRAEPILGPVDDNVSSTVTPVRCGREVIGLEATVDAERGSQERVVDDRGRGETGEHGSLS